MQPFTTPIVEPVTTPPSWQIKLLYDGECPLCVREVNFLKKRDADRGIIAFVNIADDDYTPQAQAGVSFEAAMGRIHAILPDGTLVKNLEVFRRVYNLLGMGWIYTATQWLIIGPIAERLYEIWADWRLFLTGRPNLSTILRERQKRLECNSPGRCQLGNHTKSDFKNPLIKYYVIPAHAGIHKLFEELR